MNDPHSQNLFYSVLEKALGCRRKLDLLGRIGYGEFEIVVVTSVKHRICRPSSIPGFYRFVDEHELQSLEDHPRVIWLLNSNLAEIGFPNLPELKKHLPQSLFVVHDFDHHHWQLGTRSALDFSDIYISAHPYKPLLTERYNEFSHFSIGCGCLQFSEVSVVGHLKSVSVKRHSEPYGPHFFYPNFHFRNGIVQTLHQSYSSVYLKKRVSFDLPSESVQLQEWCSHLCHWIVPVGGDLPIRFFDALCTGGIPIIPIGLKPYAISLGVPESHFVTYSCADVLSPKGTVEQAERLFFESSVLDRAMFYLRQFQYGLQVERFLQDFLNRIFPTGKCGLTTDPKGNS